MKNFFLGLVVGICLSVLWFSFSEKMFGKIYMVKSIQSHYPQGEQNSETTLIVYLKGNSGHTKKILCAFPPSLRLVGNNEIVWAGLKKVKIKGPAQQYMFGKISYYAEKIE